MNRNYLSGFLLAAAFAVAGVVRAPHGALVADPGPHGQRPSASGLQHNCDRQCTNHPNTPAAACRCATKPTVMPPKQATVPRLVSAMS